MMKTLRVFSVLFITANAIFLGHQIATHHIFAMTVFAAVVGVLAMLAAALTYD